MKASSLVAAPSLHPQRIVRRYVDTAYMLAHVGIVNLSGGAPVVETLEAKMVLFGLVFLTMTIITTLYFT